MKKGKLIIYIVSWLMVFAVLSLFIKPVRITNCTAQEGRILMTGRSGYELSVPYDKVTDIEHRREMDYGALIDGVDDGKEKSGRWVSDELGEYLLCVNAQVKSCIILRVNDQVLTFNYESEQSTQALHDALLEQVTNKANR